MPGPKMGVRPADFDEAIVRQAPTFVKWQSLRDGEKLRYACRDFIKGYGEDEERLMRRIMIARRNNLRDHEMLKRARACNRGGGGKEEAVAPAPKKARSKVQAPNPTAAVAIAAEELPELPPTAAAEDAAPEAAAVEVDEAEMAELVADDEGFPPFAKRRRGADHSGPGSGCVSTQTDAEVLREMDLPAVEATRSYKAWLALEDGREFTYNQRYAKGKEGHDWLLKKNIWRRMRYRRENKRMVQRLRCDVSSGALPPPPLPTASAPSLAVHRAMKMEADAAAAAAVAAVLPPLPGHDGAEHPPPLDAAAADQQVLVNAAAAAAASAVVDHALLAPGEVGALPVARTPEIGAAAASSRPLTDEAEDLVHRAVVEAAVAAAESYVQKAREQESMQAAAAAAMGQAAAAGMALADSHHAAAAPDADMIAAVVEMPVVVAATEAPAAALLAVHNPIIEAAEASGTGGGRAAPAVDAALEAAAKLAASSVQPLHALTPSEGGDSGHVEGRDAEEMKIEAI